MTAPSHTDEPQNSSMLDQALAAFQEAIALVDREEEPGFYGVALHDIADVHKAKGDLEEAAARYRESVKYKLLANNSKDLATTLLAFGDCLIDNDEPTEARTILDQAKDLLAKETDLEPARRAVRVHDLGAAFERLGNEGQEGAYSEALDAYHLTLELLNADADPGSYATVLRDIGDVHRAQHRLPEAVAAYEAAVKHMRRRPDAERSVADILVALGRARRRLGMREEPPIARRLEDQPPPELATEASESSGQRQKGSDLLR